MKLEDQVCLFEQAAIIYSFSVRFDSTLFQWSQNNNTGENKIFLSDINPVLYDWVYLFPAYTVAELGVLLPANIHDGRTYHNFSAKTPSEFVVGYESELGSDDMIQFGHENLAVCFADLLIWLLESNYLKPEDLKL